MTTTTSLSRTAAAPGATTTPAGARPAFLGALGGRPALGFIGPNWFSAVMGTGIVANAAATLPGDLPGLPVLALAAWLLAAVLLAAVTTATAAHWVRHPATARGHLVDPVLSHFHGAPAMALMTVGTGAVLVGRPLLGDGLAVGVDAVLWSVGTSLGLVTAVAVPYVAFTRHAVGPEAAGGGWLMPVVPPMVSAATGPLLLPHLPAGQWRLALQLACSMMFGLSLLAALVVITLVWGRLARHGVGPAAAVPTLWIVLGPLGQSVTAAHTLGVTAPGVLAAPYGTAYRALGLVYGAPVWGFAMLWLAVVAAITVRVARTTPGGLPFSLAWWSFTFPVGTLVTGTSGLAAATGATFLVVAAVGLYAGLVTAWVVVAARTARGAWSGTLLRGPV